MIEKEQALKLMGLNDNEIKVYLANLQIGSNLVQEIANFAGLNRTSAYDILKSLEQKGFVSFAIKSGKKYYQATPPNNLFSMIKEKENLIKKSLPELNSLMKGVNKRPSIEVYAGKEGLKTIFEDILNESKSFLCIASKKHLLNLFEYYFPHFVERRKKKGINVKLISNSPPLDPSIPHKLVNKKIKTATFIYKGKIAMLSLDKKEPIGLLIDEKNFYETQKALFELLWERLD